MPSSSDKTNRGAVQRQQRQPQPQQAPPQPEGPNPWQVLHGDLERNRDLYGDLLGRGGKVANGPQVDRFLVTCYQAVWQKPDLLDADRDSLLLAFAEAAAVGLDLTPTAKEGFVEVRSGLARFATQYPGLIKLIYRANDVDFIHADVVRKGDFFRQVGGSDPKIEHIAAELGTEPPDYDEDGSILAAYAVIKIKGSTRAVHEVARKADFMKARQMSKGPAWNAWFARMAIKVPLRRLANRMPGADEVRQVLAVEDAQERGERVTLERVADLFQRHSEPSAMPKRVASRDDLAALMGASGPAGGERRLPTEHEDAGEQGGPENG